VRYQNEECKPVNYKKSKNYKKNYKKYRGGIYNRDKNAVLNMIKIMENIIKKGKRPEIYER
jgi:hypothetical protein